MLVATGVPRLTEPELEDHVLLGVERAAQLAVAGAGAAAATYGLGLLFDATLG